MIKRCYDFRGYEGPDANIKTSLLEYGLIWKKNLKGHKGDYHFIYGVDHDGEYYYSFDWADVPIGVNLESEFDFVAWDSVASFVGMTKEEFLSQSVPSCIYDLITYYGSNEILGESSFPFEIR